MRATTIFDVLVVYGDTLATSAMSPSASTGPFSQSAGCEYYNDAYGYLLASCENANLRAAFTTSADIVGPGTCRSYWTYSKGVWQATERRGVAKIIFDKFAPSTAHRKRAREILFSSGSIVPFNDPALYQLFFDKYDFFTHLSSYTIPTVAVEDDILFALSELGQLMDSHPHPADFLSDFVLKDRYGSTGSHVYRIDSRGASRIREIVGANPKISFVLQPMVRFDQGGKGTLAQADIRLIFNSTKIIQTYLRVAKEGEFRCNGHYGSTTVYLTERDLPVAVRALAKHVVQELPKNDSIYALDFLLSNHGHPYLLEGNTGPGINWDANDPYDIRVTKGFIRKIVAELSRRVRVSERPHHRNIAISETGLSLIPS